jgi:hypothetical protein
VRPTSKRASQGVFVGGGEYQNNRSGQRPA